MFELWSFSLQCLTSSYCTEEKLQKMHEQSFPNKKPIENAGTHLDLCVFSKFGIFWSCENAPRNIREKIVIFHYNWPRSDQPYYRSDGTKSKWQISSLSHNCQPTCQVVFFMEFSHLSFISTFDFDGWVVFIKVQPFGKAFPQRQRSIENKYKLLHLICHCFPTFPAIIIIINITYIKNNLSLHQHLICAHILCKLWFQKWQKSLLFFFPPYFFFPRFYFLFFFVFSPFLQPPNPPPPPLFLLSPLFSSLFLLLFWWKSRKPFLAASSWRKFRISQNFREFPRQKLF